MVEYSKDDDDLALEALFASGPIADDGFSRKVVRRVRRRLLVRRLALPVAVSAGALIAAKPLLAVMVALKDFAALLPLDALPVPEQVIPQVSLWFVVSIAALAGLIFLPTLDD